MLKTLDRIWFTIKDRFLGYDRGYIDGFKAAQEVTQAQTEARLREYNPRLKDQSFQLGYGHAAEVVKGSVK